MEDKTNKKHQDTPDDKTRVLNRAMRLCSGQEKCIEDIRKKMQEWKVPDEYHEFVISELIKHGFIDEYRYTLAFVNDKFRLAKWGKVKIAYALKGKKISSALIHEALDNIDDQEYFQLIEKELLYKNKSLEKSDSFAAKAKLFRFAQSRGFEAEPAIRAINKILKTN